MSGNRNGSHEGTKTRRGPFLEQLLDGAEVEWMPLSKVAAFSKTRIAHSLVNEDNYVGGDNLLQNLAGKTASNHVPSEGNLTEYL